MRKYTIDEVKKAITIVFPTQDPKLIFDLLSEYGKEDYEREKERVYLAILKLSKGNVDDLLYHINAAKGDYRDVLSWAEYHSTGPTLKDGVPIENPYASLGVVYP